MQLPAHPHQPRPRLARVLAAALVVLAPAGLAAPVNAQPSWRFVVVGDTRSASSSEVINAPIVAELANEIVRHDARFVLVPGDLVYSGSLPAFELWKAGMGPVYQAGIPVLPVVGNHDAADIPAWKQAFGPGIPDNGPAGEIDRTYWFTYDNVLVLALDQYVTSGRVNQAWVDATLAANTLPHVFAFGHMPAFKANHADCLDDYPAGRDAFWNSLRAAGAGAYFAGHDHFYDHARIDDGDGNSGNDVHQLITGTGGAPFHSTYAYDGANTAWTPVNQYHEMQYGYSVIEIDGRQATVTFYHRVGANAYAPAESWTYTAGTPPVAAASSNVTSGIAPLTVQFTGSASHDPDGSIDGFAWSFGDGGSSSLADPSHTYAVKGAYTAILTVTDNHGLTGSASVAITVTDPPTAATIHVGDLDGSRTASRKSWSAKVTVAVHSPAHARVAGAVVTGRWSTGAVTSCTTGSKGTCSVVASSIPPADGSVTFEVTGIAKPDASYLPGSNHDADGGSNGTVITVTK